MVYVAIAFLHYARYPVHLWLSHRDHELAAALSGLELAVVPHVKFKTRHHCTETAIANPSPAPPHSTPTRTALDATKPEEHNSRLSDQTSAQPHSIQHHNKPNTMGRTQARTPKSTERRFCATAPRTRQVLSKRTAGAGRLSDGTDRGHGGRQQSTRKVLSNRTVGAKFLAQVLDRRKKVLTYLPREGTWQPHLRKYLIPWGRYLPPQGRHLPCLGRY